MMRQKNVFMGGYAKLSTCSQIKLVFSKMFYVWLWWINNCSHDSEITDYCFCLLISDRGSAGSCPFLWIIFTGPAIKIKGGTLSS